MAKRRRAKKWRGISSWIDFEHWYIYTVTASQGGSVKCTYNVRMNLSVVTCKVALGKQQGFGESVP